MQRGFVGLGLFTRHRSLTLAVVGLALALQGCAGIDRFGERGGRPVTQAPASAGSLPGSQDQPSSQSVVEMPLDAPINSTLGQSDSVPGSGAAGTGAAVALLLPLSASGQVGELAQAMKNAAELAQSEYKGTQLRLLVKDEGGQAEGARSAARAAQTEGAQVFLGPLLSSSVQAAAAVTRPAGKALIGFSTDQTVAGRGVYLLSFQPDNDIEQILAYAASKGKTSIAALIPEGVYGNVMVAAFQEQASRRGLKIASIERYQAATVETAVKAIAALTVPVDALLIPEGGDQATALNTCLLYTSPSPRDRG